MCGLKLSHCGSSRRLSFSGFPAAAAVEYTGASSRTMVGYGACNRCVQEGRYDRCYAFEGTDGALVCQYCGHSWHDHS
jgi:hypothetical protein